MRFEPPRPRNDEERILPLINVVFLLLIFFMLAGRIAASDPYPIEPPLSGSQAAPGRQDALVLLGADGRLALDGEPVGRDDLGAAIARRLEEGARVRLKADSRARGEDVVALMEHLREAGVERLKLLTVPRAAAPAGG